MTTMNDMGQLAGYREDPTTMERLGARQQSARACRCFYLGEMYAHQAKYGEAQVRAPGWSKWTAPKERVRRALMTT